MPGFSQSLAQAIYAATLAPTRTPLVAPLTATGTAAVYCSLHTAAPTDAAGGNEATYSGYARVNVAALMSSSTSGVSPETSVVATNTGDINFPASAGSTQTVTHWAIWDHVTGAAAANLLYSGPLSASRSVQIGDVVVIPAGQLLITLS